MLNQTNLITINLPKSRVIFMVNLKASEIQFWDFIGGKLSWHLSDKNLEIVNDMINELKGYEVASIWENV